MLTEIPVETETTLSPVTTTAETTFLSWEAVLTNPVETTDDFYPSSIEEIPSSSINELPQVTEITTSYTPFQTIQDSRATLMVTSSIDVSPQYWSTDSLSLSTPQPTDEKYFADISSSYSTLSGSSYTIAATSTDFSSQDTANYHEASDQATRNALLGGVIGSAVLLGGAAAVVFMRRQKRRRHSLDDTPSFKKSSMNPLYESKAINENPFYVSMSQSLDVFDPATMV